MKSTRNYLVAILAVLLLAGGALAWKQHRELIELRAKIAADDSARLKKQLADLQAQLKTLHDQVATQGGSGGGPAGPGGSASGPAGRAPVQSVAAAPVNLMAQLMQNPAAQKLMNLQAKAQLDARYAPLFKSLNLSPDQLDQFKNLLVEKQQAMMDAMQAAREQGLDPRTDPAGFRAALDDAQKTVDAQIASSLGEAGFAQYQQFQQTIPERNTVGQLATSLSYTQTPLTSDQEEAMINVLAQTQPQKTGNGTAGTTSITIGMGGMMNAGGTSQVTAESIAQASAVLSAPQLAALQQIQAQQQAQQQMNAIMMRQMGGGSTSATATTLAVGTAGK